MAENYPVTLHHPDPKIGATQVVESKEQQARWEKQGWLTSSPSADSPRAGTTSTDSGKKSS